MAHVSEKSPYPEDAPKLDLAKVEEIDKSARIPVLFFFTAAIFWLFAGAAIGMLAYFKFRFPGHLSEDPRTWFFGTTFFNFMPAYLDFTPALTFGRLKPAFHHVFIYGWACSAAFGTALWMMARLCRVRLPAPGVLVTVGHLWHLGVLVGLVSILVGGPSGLEWLDMHPVAAGILFISYLPLAGIAFYLFFTRQSQSGGYIATRYLVAGLFWFPWIFGLANALFISGTLTGVLTPMVNFWYVDAFIMLWLTPIALATAYFMIPKITGRPLANYSYAPIAFWAIALLGGLLGMRHLDGYPVPEWLVTMSTSAGLLLAIPALMVLMNFIKPLGDGYSVLGENVSLRFITMGLAGFFLTHTVGALAQQEFIHKATQFTISSDAYLFLTVYFFPSFVFFGAIYHIMPRVLGYQWHSRRLVEFHYWVTFFAVAMLTVFLFFGGAAQGAVLNEANNTIFTVWKQVMLTTWLALFIWGIITISNFVFLYNLIASLWSVYSPAPIIQDLVAVPPDDEPDAGQTIPAESEAQTEQREKEQREPASAPA